MLISSKRVVTVIQTKSVDHLKITHFTKFFPPLLQKNAWNKLGGLLFLTLRIKDLDHQICFWMHGFFEGHKSFLVWTKIYLLETANRRGLSQILMIQIIQKAVVLNTDRTLSNNQL